MDNNFSMPRFPQEDSLTPSQQPDTSRQMPISQMPSDLDQNPISDDSYPEIYYDLYPMVRNAIEDARRRGIPLTQENLNNLIDQVIRDSGLWDEDDDFDDDSMTQDNTYWEAIPAQYGMYPSRERRRRRMRRGHHNRNTLRDLLRILFLRDLFRYKSW